MDGLCFELVVLNEGVDGGVEFVGNLPEGIAVLDSVGGCLEFLFCGGVGWEGEVEFGGSFFPNAI